jgi:hypothetical protein
MPLYVHRSGEIKRTVPGRHEDQRVSGHPDWRPITKDDLDRIRAAAVDARQQIVDELFAKGRKRS